MNNGDRRSAHTGTLRRAGYAAGLGILLFSAGYGIYESGVIGRLY
ncbi:MAG TPA: cytochrome C, partial [Cupriavidus sp.]|nr:cytochrome C [Cupriavidus sp.]